MAILWQVAIVMSSARSAVNANDDCDGSRPTAPVPVTCLVGMHMPLGCGAQRRACMSILSGASPSIITAHHTLAFLCGRFAGLALITLGLYSCCHTAEHVATYKEVVKQLTTYLSEVNAELAAKGFPAAFSLETVDGELVVSIDIR